MIAHILQVNIDGNMFFFLGDSTDSLFTTKCQLVESGKTLHCVTDLRGTSLLGHPVDHIHGIIKKMGIDLSLQGIKLGNSQILSSLGLFFHKLVHFACHIVVSINKITNFIVRTWAVHRDRRTVTDCSHLTDNGGNSPCNGFGQGTCEQKGKRQYRNINGQKLQNQDITLIDQGLGGKYRHHKPAWLFDTVETNVNGFPQNILLHETVGGHVGLHDLVVIQPVNSGERITGSRNQVVTLIHNIRNTAVQSKIFRQDLLKIMTGIIDRHISIISSVVIDYRSMGDICLISICLLFLCTKIEGGTKKLGNAASAENTIPVGSTDLIER